MAFVWRFGLLLGHVAAMRQVYHEDWEDKLVCECTEVKSVSDCPDYKIKKGGFPPSFPHYYHEKVQTSLKYVNLCCRMTSEELVGKGSKWNPLRKKYVRQSTKERCLEERRPLPQTGCCSLAGAAKVYEDPLRIVLSHATSYSMAHDKMRHEGTLTFQDYEKKSKVMIKPEDVSHAYGYRGSSIPAKKVVSELEEVKKLLTDKDPLQCEEDLPEVATSRTDKGYCKAYADAKICCCSNDAMSWKNKNFGCFEHECAPKQSPLDLSVTHFKKHSEMTARWTEVSYESEWEDPWAECPERMQVGTATLDLASSQWKDKGRCTQKQTLEVGIVDRTDVKPRKKDYCIRQTVNLLCSPGSVLYKVNSIGQRQDDGGWFCPGEYSNIPGDPKFNSECTC